MSRARVMLFASCVVASGCAAPEAQIPADVLQRMQSESRREIYDRENDLAIARNKLDEVRIRAEAVKRQQAEIDELEQRIRKKLGKAGIEKALKLDAPLSARKAYLDVQLKQLDAERAVAEAQANAARGRLEQTRQRELVRTGRALAKTMAPFDKNVEALDKKLAAAEHKEADLKQETEKSYEAWKASEDEFTKVTGDWDTAIWTE